MLGTAVDSSRWAAGNKTHKLFEISSCTLLPGGLVSITLGRGELLPCVSYLVAEGWLYVPDLEAAMCCNVLPGGLWMMAFAYIITEPSINRKYLEQGSQLPSPIHPLSGGRDPVEKSCLHSEKNYTWWKFGETHLVFLSLWGKVCMASWSSTIGGRRVILQSSAMQLFRTEKWRKKVRAKVHSI